MISVRNRFHGRNSLNPLYKKGKTVRSEAITLRHLANNKQNYRLTVVVSKKVSKKAVVRNRIRRRIYETVRVINKQSDANWPHDMSISVFDDSFATKPYAELRLQIEKLLQKANII